MHIAHFTVKVQQRCICKKNKLVFFSVSWNVNFIASQIENWCYCTQLLSQLPFHGRKNKEMYGVKFWTSWRYFHVMLLLLLVFLFLHWNNYNCTVKQFCQRVYLDTLEPIYRTLKSFELKYFQPFEPCFHCKIRREPGTPGPSFGSPTVYSTLNNTLPDKIALHPFYVRPQNGSIQYLIAYHINKCNLLVIYTF